MTMNLIALAEILGHKGARQIATGETDAEGAPIFQTVAAPILPGEAFTAEPATAAALIRAKAAAPAGSEAAEEAIRRSREAEA